MDDQKLSRKVILHNQNRKEQKHFAKQIQRYVETQLPSAGGTKDNLCLQCCKNLIDIVMIPCGHAVICSTCLDDTCWHCGHQVMSIATI